ncbi:MAG: lamin tail domain-containing protein [Kiritimatiellae bacterium]|nr:lamin tail domain-containing protein [Kiritimatiellia bacterium]
MAVFSALVANATVRITEFSASNSRTIRDEFGDASDWIELANIGTQTVNLAGWRLTDEIGNLSKWVFPSTNIAPGEYWVIFASGRNRATPGRELHTNFELKKDGEYLALVASNGVIVQALNPFPTQATDVAYGLLPATTSMTLVVRTNAPCRYRVPDADPPSEWVFEWYDDSAWPTGRTGVGFGANYSNYLGSTVSNEMFNRRTAVQIRIPFVVERPAAVQSLTLEMQFDDGYMAWINGRAIWATNLSLAYLPPNWNSTATAENDGHQVSQVGIRKPWSRLVVGTNVLAIYGFNRATNNSDLLIRAGLVATTEQYSVNSTNWAFFYPPTPGAPNVPQNQVRGPVIESAYSSGRPIPAGQNLVLTAAVRRVASDIQWVRAYYVVMFGSETAVLLKDDGVAPDAAAGDGTFSGTVPTGVMAVPGQMVRWRYEARDKAGGVTLLPPFSDPWDSSQYFGTVMEDRTITSRLPLVHVFMPNWSAAYNEVGTYGCVWHLDEFYDRVRFDLHGQSTSGGAFPKKSLNLDFPSDHRFHYGGPRRVKDIDLLSNWADKAKVRNVIPAEWFAAFDMPAHFSFPVRVHSNGVFFSTYDLIEDADNRFIERLGFDGDGALYKMYQALTSSVVYAEKKTRRDEPNTDLQELIDALNPARPLAERSRWVFDNVDIPRAVNYFAARAVINDVDHGHKNYYLYRDSEGSLLWMLLPWDVDLCLGHRWTSTYNYFDPNVYTNESYLSGSGNRLYRALLDTPAVRSMVAARMRTAMDRFLGPPGTTNGWFEQRIRWWLDQLDPPDVAVSDADLDYAKWGSWTPWQTAREAGDEILNLFLPGRRWYLETQTVTNGGLIPMSPPDFSRVAIRRIESSPPSGNQDEEYIELVNTNSWPVDLSGWSFSNAVRFVFPGGTILLPGSNLFVCADFCAFRTRPVSPRSNEMAYVTGPFAGHLSSWGESVELWDHRGRLVAATNYPPSPSAWQQYLRVTEIMFHPTPPPASSPWTDDREFEWLELANLGDAPLNLKGVRFTAGIQWGWTNDVWLPPAGRVVVARNPAAFASRYDTNGIVVFGPCEGYLDDSGEELKLEDPNNETILEFDYNDAWQPAADGEGASLVITNLAAPHSEWGRREHWGASWVWQGTPGRPEPGMGPAWVLINEWLAHGDVTPDWIELYNPGEFAVDIGGWWLSDDLARLRKFVIPAGTVIPPGGYLVLGESAFNSTNHPGCVVPFALSELGEEIHLTAVTNGVATSWRQSVVFEASDREVTFGRHLRSDGVVKYPPLSAPTPGAPNAPPKVGPVTITEILYAPLAGGVEYVEILAVTNGLVPLYEVTAPTNRWRVSGGIAFTFPPNTVLTGRQYALVVGGDPVAFRASNSIPRHIQIFGPFTNVLDNAGDTVRLRKPGYPNADGFVPFILADEVEYDDVWPWPPAGRLDGRSIEKIRPTWYGNDPAHWRAGVPRGTPGGPCSNGDANTNGIPDEWELVQFGSLGPSNALADRDGNGRADLLQFLDGSGVSNALTELMLVAVSNRSGLVSFEARRAEGPGYQGRRRYYAVETTTSLTAGVWSPLPGFMRIEGAGQTVVVTNGPAPSSRMLRVRAWLEELPE